MKALPISSMPKMATVPVFACRGCGTPVYGVHLEARDMETLKELMQGMAQIALCGNCKGRYNYLAAQNRSDEFPLNPNLIIYNVIDKSGNDYYGRKA